MVRKYFNADFPEGVTPSRFKRLSRVKKRALMEAWFREYFEDPANQTPYDGREGGYQYVWGGPYEALGELTGEFGDIAPPILIAELADELTGENPEWAPSSNHPDMRGEEPEISVVRALTDDDELDLYGDAEGFDTEFGTETDVRWRSQIQKRIEDVETTIASLQKPRGMMGHNNPPEDINAPTIGTRDLQELTAAILELKTEIGRDTPDIPIVAARTGRIRRVAITIAKWAGAKADIVATEFAKEFGKQLGKMVAWGPVGFTVVGLLGGLWGLIGSVQGWLGSVVRFLF